MTTTTATTPGIDCPYCGPQRHGVTQCGCGYTPERDKALRDLATPGLGEFDCVNKFAHGGSNG